MQFEIRNKRVVVYDHQIPSTADVRCIEGGRHYMNLKPSPGYTFPLEKLPMLKEYLLQHTVYHLDERWYNLFPEYKHFRV